MQLIFLSSSWLLLFTWGNPITRMHRSAHSLAYTAMGVCITKRPRSKFEVNGCLAITYYFYIGSEMRNLIEANIFILILATFGKSIGVECVWIRLRYISHCSFFAHIYATFNTYDRPHFTFLLPKYINFHGFALFSSCPQPTFTFPCWWLRCKREERPAFSLPQRHSIIMLDLFVLMWRRQ